MVFFVYFCRLNQKRPAPNSNATPKTISPNGFPPAGSFVCTGTGVAVGVGVFVGMVGMVTVARLVGVGVISGWAVGGNDVGLAGTVGDGTGVTVAGGSLSATCTK